MPNLETEKFASLGLTERHDSLSDPKRMLLTFMRQAPPVSVPIYYLGVEHADFEPRDGVRMG